MRSSRILLALLVLIAAASLVYLLKSGILNVRPSGASQTTVQKLIDGCTITQGSQYVMCAYENGQVVSLDPRTMPKCGQTVIVKVSLRDFTNVNLNITDFYYLCARNTRLTTSPSNQFSDWTYSTYDPQSNTEFSCMGKLYGKSEAHFYSNVGALPSSSGAVNFFELYAFPSTFKFSGINDFANNIGAAQKILGLEGDVAC